MRMGEPRVFLMAITRARLPPEIFPAKEAKRRFDCGGKHLGCPGHDFPGASGGLQCGLSGNRAAGNGALERP